MQYLLFLLALLISSASYSNDQIKNDEPFKWQGSENANETVFNEDYDNPKITCTDKDGNVYSRDKSIYKTCDELFEKISNNNDLYLSIDTILGEWQGVGEYEGDSYPVYLKFFTNSRNILVGKYFYGNKYQHEEGGDLLLIEDNLVSKKIFKMKWYENNDSGSFNFELFPNGSLVGIWSDNYAYGGTYRITKISNNVPKLENGKNSNTIEPISQPNF